MLGNVAGLSSLLSPPRVRRDRNLPVGNKNVSIWGAAAQAQNPDTSGKLLKRFKFVLRAWLQRRFTRAWLARLVQPDLAPLWALHPRLALKLQRPYVCCAWDAPIRCAALLGHYDLLPRLFGPATRLAIYREGVTILRLVCTPASRDLELRLFYHDKFEKEGEITLAVRDAASGLILAGLTFLLVSNKGQRLAIIGGLQASNDPATRGHIHDAAKSLHGLRPKALALWCLQELAAGWSVTQIQAVGDAQHVWRHWRKRREVAARYDDFWRECDGRELSGGGSWELPLQLHERPRQELKPKRRKQHELRYALLAGLRPKLRAAMADLAPGHDGAGRSPEYALARREPFAAPQGESNAATAAYQKQPPKPAPTINPILHHSF